MLKTISLRRPEVTDKRSKKDVRADTGKGIDVSGIKKLKRSGKIFHGISRKSGEVATDIYFNSFKKGGSQYAMTEIRTIAVPKVFKK